MAARDFDPDQIDGTAVIAARIAKGGKLGFEIGDAGLELAELKAAANMALVAQQLRQWRADQPAGALPVSLGIFKIVNIGEEGGHAANPLSAVVGLHNHQVPVASAILPSSCANCSICTHSL